MSVFVDSSVWINHFRGTQTQAVRWLRQILETQEWSVITGDLVLMEVLRGCRSEAQALKFESALLAVDVAQIAGLDESIRAAALYRKLRAQGITMSKAVDLLIASWCIHEGVSLLQEDKDFLPLAPFGLRLVSLS